MTKKHFIALANAIIEFNERNPAHLDSFHIAHIDVIADFCASQNSNFDRERFMGYIAGTNGPNGGVKK